MVFCYFACEFEILCALLALREAAECSIVVYWLCENQRSNGINKTTLTNCCKILRQQRLMIILVFRVICLFFFTLCSDHH